MELSVVIIVKNEANNIADCIRSAFQITGNVVVVDTGSSDNTMAIAKMMGAQVYAVPWRGYGDARNHGAILAEHDWIFSLDADERIPGPLAKKILTIATPQEYTIYGFKRTNFFKKDLIRFGCLASEKVFRIYHKERTQWENVPVHEKLMRKDMSIVLLPQTIEHYGIQEIPAYITKRENYAALCAERYLSEGKTGAGVLKYIAPIFYFIKSYFLKAGFLDGKTGFTLAWINACYTAEKYRHLCRMQQEAKYQGISYPSYKGILKEVINSRMG